MTDPLTPEQAALELDRQDVEYELNLELQIALCADGSLCTCSEWDGKERPEKTVWDTLVAARIALRRRQPQWISVQEKLPSPCELVYVAAIRQNGELIDGESFWHGEFWNDVEDQSFPQPPKITHWMRKPALPAPPAGKGQK